MIVVAGTTENTMSAAVVAELEIDAGPEGMIEQVDTIVRFCPDPAMVSVLVELEYEPLTEPVRTAEFAVHPVTEILQLIAVNCIGVTPAPVVAPIAARLALPSHTMVNGRPATLPPVQMINMSLEMDCGAAGVGVPAVRLLVSVPTNLKPVHWSVTLDVPTATWMYTGTVVAVAVTLPPGLTITLAPAPVAKLKEAATTRPTTPNLRNMPDILCTSLFVRLRDSTYDPRLRQSARARS